MKRTDLEALGIPVQHHGAAFAGVKNMAAAHLGPDEMTAALAAVAAAPGAHREDPHLGDLAAALAGEPAPAAYVPREEPAGCGWWAPSDIEPVAIQQMNDALSLPVTVAGALMPDAHSGFGVPIGGVVATDGAVIPKAVGVDIGCRVMLSLIDIPVPGQGGGAESADPEQAFKGAVRERLIRALMSETRFGKGATFENRDRRHHPILDDPDWNASPALARLKDRAWYQLGSSGGGNHFVDFGIFETPGGWGAPDNREGTHWVLGRPRGRFLAILSHSGSRGPGKAVADYFEGVARRQHPELPAELQELAWLSMDDEEGLAYWQAMNLMGRFSAANHEVIHRELVAALGGEILTSISNHHNFAWLEEHGGRELVVHRKGATPASAGELGVIPGTMADSAFLVRGRGEPTSLRSASHGAGRAMSPTQVRRTVSPADVAALLEERQVLLLEGDLGESPQGYKDIHRVMALQQQLVDVLGTFTPRIVRMAPKPERAGRGGEG